MDQDDFEAMPFSRELLATIKNLGFKKLTPIQAATIPLILDGCDLIGKSQTGSGKTAAFALPTLQKIRLDLRKPQALILCPTRELSEQVHKEFQKFAKQLNNFSSIALVGGRPYPPQLEELARGPQVVVGTPGRTLELINQGQLNLLQINTLILDEADRLLDEGFNEEIAQIIKKLPSLRQTLYFSATFSEALVELSKKYQKSPKIISFLRQAEPPLHIKQFIYQSEGSEKIKSLLAVLQKHQAPSILIFCRTKDMVKEVSNLLRKARVACRPLHADLEQTTRDLTWLMFGNGSLRMLIATDIAARGLDINQLDLVINFDLPASHEIYLHRIGRTGRAGKSGVAVSLVTSFDSDLIAQIETSLQDKLIREPLDLALNLTTIPMLSPIYQQPKMKTLQLFCGAKDQLQPADLLKTLMKPPDIIGAKDIGAIVIEQQHTYVPVAFNMAGKALKKLCGNKIKGKRYKVLAIDP